MPRANDAGASNGLLQRIEEHTFHPKEEPSPGTSSLTSESKQDKSGSSPLASESSLQSPAPPVESHSDQDQAAPQAPSSTASSTDGSTQETGPSPAGQPDSSEPSPAKTEATPAPTENAQSDAEELLDSARKAYNDHNYRLANDLVTQAEELYPPITETTGPAHAAINAALAATTPTQTNDN